MHPLRTAAGIAVAFLLPLVSAFFLFGNAVEMSLGPPPTRTMGDATGEIAAYSALYVGGMAAGIVVGWLLARRWLYVLVATLPAGVAGAIFYYQLVRNVLVHLE